MPKKGIRLEDFWNQASPEARKLLEQSPDFQRYIDEQKAIPRRSITTPLHAKVSLSIWNYIVRRLIDRLLKAMFG